MPNRAARRRRGRRHRRSPSVEEPRGTTSRKRHRSRSRGSSSGTPERHHRQGEGRNHLDFLDVPNARNDDDSQRTKDRKKQRREHSPLYHATPNMGQHRRTKEEGVAAQLRGHPHFSTGPVLPHDGPQVPPPVVPTLHEAAELTRGPVLATPPAPKLHVETVEERRHLTRFPVPSTTSVEDLWAPVLGDSLGAGILGDGAPSLRPLLPPVLSQRPPTPTLLPMAGAASPPSSGPSSLPLSPKVIPFSYDEYVKWLYTAPARSGIGGATGKDVGLQRHMEGAPPSDSAAGAATPSAPPSPLCEIPQHPTPHVDTAASSALPGDEIGYERNFAVATNWEAVVAAPPLLPFTPLLPSVWASRSPDQQGGRVSSATSLLHPGRQSLSVKTAKQGGEADGVGPATPMKSGSEGLTQSPVLQEALRSTSILPAGTSVPAAISMDASQAIFLSSPLHPAVESGQVHTVRNAASPALSPQWGEDAKDEGLRAFVKHFQHGKVHTRPPWFLCSTLLTNCEHPYYVNWLDELQLGSVEEELAWARATQGSVLGDPSQFQ